MPLLIVLVFSFQAFGADFDSASRRAVPRDAFPVLNNPRMVKAKDVGDDVRGSEPVLGVFLGGQAKAYPISVMGSHELGNDTCGGKPIAVSW